MSSKVKNGLLGLGNRPGELDNEKLCSSCFCSRPGNQESPVGHKHKVPRDEPRQQTEPPTPSMNTPARPPEAANSELIAEWTDHHLLDMLNFFCMWQAQHDLLASSSSPQQTGVVYVSACEEIKLQFTRLSSVTVKQLASRYVELVTQWIEFSVSLHKSRAEFDQGIHARVQSRGISPIVFLGLKDRIEQTWALDISGLVPQRPGTRPRRDVADPAFNLVCVAQELLRARIEMNNIS
ncbi:uncharacterized protein PGTG_10126 [Puccinia graminis f. sp. tritici CRL 75-36-700-3]|uniref:Uncharacterized protein n=1 Tax=Puccinia graminis f. sp. tritici (strain CRL 75-36-700-3 / race SCCL) TaxID=418459 RepID=E3KJD1_PUCGT|nr:uncharacterized protein PGTG_10126 [Puccinia graminis f. sp. tritici CRL 75-36-700-3]EFP84406.2 hypothetical protein PGTG_10126 [Puccinia graminis f. sp. tritici CRL 75-36-700-3]